MLAFINSLCVKYKNKLALNDDYLKNKSLLIYAKKNDTFVNTKYKLIKLFVAFLYIQWPIVY